MAFWWRKQKLQWCNCKPNNAKERQQNQKLEKERKYSTLQVSEETWPCWQLGFWVLAFKTVRWQISAASSSQFLVLCYGSLRKLFNGTGQDVPVQVEMMRISIIPSTGPSPVGSAASSPPRWGSKWEMGRNLTDSWLTACAKSSHRQAFLRVPVSSFLKMEDSKQEKTLRTT